MRGRGRRLRAAALAVLVLAGAACEEDASTPTDEVVIEFDDFRLDLPLRRVRDVDRTFTFYAGAAPRSFRFNLSVTSLPAGASVEVSEAQGAVVQTITADGEAIRTNTISGNVGRLRVQIPGTAAAPDILVRSLETDRPQEFAALPVVSEQVTNRVTAFPLTPNEPVDVFFPPDETTYFFSVSGIEAPELDVMLFGAGRVRIGDPAIDWPLGDDSTIEVVEHRTDDATPDGFAFTRFPMAARDGLLFAVTNEGLDPAAGHARFLVGTVQGVRRLSFPSTIPGDFLPTVIGIDHDPAPGTAGPAGGRLDCTNWQGIPGVVSLPRPPTPPPPPGASPAPSPPALDLPGIPACYDGHEGVDYPLAGGPIAQGVGVPVSAAGPGIVLATDAAHADDCFWDPRTENITCADLALPANFVAVRHDDGIVAYYFHLRTESIVVTPGQPVGCLERLGDVGSSGQSTGPHLHFELRDLDLPDGTLPSFRHGPVRNRSTFVDPYDSDLWTRVTNGIPESVCE